MAANPITSWQMEGGKVKAVIYFIFLGSKITADGDWSHKIKRRLLLGRKAMTSLDSILKSRDITLPTKVHLVKAMVFPVVKYGYESWTIKKAECWRIDAFELWCWRQLLRFPWTARRSKSLSKLRELVMDREAWHATVHGVTKSWIWLNDWTELNKDIHILAFGLGLKHWLFLSLSSPIFQAFILRLELHHQGSWVSSFM